MSVVTKLRVDDNRPRSVLKHHTCIIAMHAVPPLWFYALRPKSLATYNAGFWVWAVDIANIRFIQSLSLPLAQTTMVHALGLYARVRRFADNSPTEPKHFSTSLNFSAYQVTNFFPQRHARSRSRSLADYSVKGSVILIYYNYKAIIMWLI